MKHDRDIERLLKGFSSRPPASGRKERVLRGAREKALARRILTPAWKCTLASCMALLLIIGLADGWTSTARLSRLSALLDISTADSVSPEEAVAEELARYREALPDLDKASSKRLQMALLKEKRAAKNKRPLDRPEEAIYEN
ncbi:MAG: hypothetical protein WBC70_02215 [Candidatus Aminicenantales bacterium]